MTKDTMVCDIQSTFGLFNAPFQLSVDFMAPELPAVPHVDA